MFSEGGGCLKEAQSEKLDNNTVRPRAQTPTGTTR